MVTINRIPKNRRSVVEYSRVDVCARAFNMSSFECTFLNGRERSPGASLVNSISKGLCKLNFEREATKK